MDKAEIYQQIITELHEFFSHYHSLSDIAKMTTISSVIRMKFPQLVYVGFYIMRDLDSRQILEVGPYQGAVLACAQIEIGNGVCGKVAELKETILVEDVCQFASYIACDCQTKSECVVPVIKDGKVLAVLDLDSDQLGFFTEVDKEWLERIAAILTN